MRKGRLLMHLFSIGDIAKLCDIPRYKIQYAIINGSLPEPELRIANKRAFSISEVKEIADYFGVELQNQIGEEAEREEE